jgi:hypothetical protein
MQSVDVESLIRAIIIAACTGFIVRYITDRLAKSKNGSNRLPWAAAVAVTVLVGVILYYAWPSLRTVPKLDKLAQAEAEELLLKKRLVPQPTPERAVDVEIGRVVPHSQSPAAGLPVHRGTVVSFGVSVSNEKSGSAAGIPLNTPTVSIFQPRSGEAIRCRAGGDGLYRCTVTGTSSDIRAGSFFPLLWLRPVNPPSDQAGWYLERSGNGISRVEADGSWTGVAQIGNSTYPPHEGDVVDVAVSLAAEGAYRELMGRGGVVVEPEPVGAWKDTASNLVVTLK